jgi:UDP-N-acetylglucosamine 2-epimerase
MKTILTVVGCRPNFIKAAVLSPVLRTKFDEVLIHTGQHSDYNMSQTFFKELEIPEPKNFLGCTSLAEMQERLTKVIMEHKPDAVLVYGDTRSAYAGATSAKTVGVPLIHVEAGCRCGDLTVPEEVNRIAIDLKSDFLFTPTQLSHDNAIETKGKKFFAGDVMFDLFLRYKAQLKSGDPSVRYAFLTLHRQDLLDDRERLQRTLNNLSRFYPQYIFPVHPHTRKVLEGLVIPRNMLLTQPFGYLDSLEAQKNAVAVVTDSGGVQREAFWLGKDLFVIRKSTEWPETILYGRGALTTFDSEGPIEVKIKKAKTDVPEHLFGDGHAAEKITQILLAEL